MDLDFSAEQDAFRSEIRAFLDEELPDGWVGLWHGADAPAHSDAVMEKLAARGWHTYSWPQEYGGRDGGVWEQTVIQEELFAHHEPRGGHYMGLNWIGPVIMKFGSPEQQATLLPEIARGEVQWAQLFSEPDAGSDLASLRTRALPAEDGDGFVVNGEKIWTSYANLARRGFLLARTERGESRHAGISVFVIDMDTPGIEVREVPSAVGNHRFHSVSFTDVRVPASALLGPLNGGWSVAMSALPYERTGNARYARSTRVLGFFEQSASLDASAEKGIAEVLAYGRMTELLNHRLVWMREREDQPTWEPSATFAATAEYETLVGDLVEEHMGYLPFVSVPDPNAVCGGEVESFTVCQAPTVKLQAGTYEIQLSIVGQQALNLPRGR
ncbi:acyl-CoA dehydrogenase [Pseudonocardia sulfidoxydans NBRC 16205]|uniref:Acyl-CoA dehydrogenase n=1 Tax=Pseudonocardia sulfidoxydans NBRC 16205 TaxID=1223511 RepID=A0A511D8U2_9PSEU|nr:acyl-CoA dehydrogenase family protein [Pseudonocardia sulfidoxydans]GEL21215.1 acyl-CoA dehydrogenase [Pseudonocardia sulfidoxydans NBRC 16205]